MNPTRWIFALFTACVAWVPLSVYLGPIAAQDQDPAGQGIYSAITTLFLLVVGGLTLGIPALLQVRRHKQQIHLCTHIAAWLILLSPVLVVGVAIVPEFIGDMVR
jgi:predicted Na+-dependent transporter